jgi:hypothetical protein
MAETLYVDEKYYQIVRSRSLGERIFIAARDRVYADFLRLCRPQTDETIVDVGVSDVINEGANVLERKYPHRHRITALGIGEGQAFQAAYPNVKYIQIEANKRLPFADNAFDIAVSNAVVEHVGSPEKQAFFIRELMRIAPRIFITVPYRYFPIEHHTSFPFLHYHDATFRLACRWTNKDEWSKQENLILMTKRKLREVLPRGANAIIGFTGVLLGPLSSNLFAYVDQREPTRGSPEPANGSAATDAAA